MNLGGNEAVRSTYGIVGRWIAIVTWRPAHGLTLNDVRKVTAQTLPTMTFCVVASPDGLTR
jgi:hypothetical protein